MTASALNIASIVPAAKAGAGAQGAAASGLAGFEALLGALFPQADPTALMGAQAGATPLTTGAAAVADGIVPGTGDAKDADADAKTEATNDAAPVAGQPTAGDAAAALAASLAAAQSSTVEVQPTVAKTATGEHAQTDKTATAAPPAWGHDKTKGIPAQPAVLGANPKAGLAGKADLTAESADSAAEAEPADAETTLADLTTVEPKTAQATPAQARSAQPAPTMPAAAAPPAQPAPVAEAAPELAAAAVAAASEASVETAAPAATAAATTAAAVTTPLATPTPAPTQPVRGAKSERKASTDAAAEPSDELKPLQAADRPATAKAAGAAAKTAADTVEAAEAKPEDAKVAPESPDALPQGETRAADQTAAPASVQAGHVVRGSPETVANMAAQIIKKLENKTTRFDVELDPHGLGKVDVRIEIGAHGRVTAGMTFENPQAAADVKARAAELQQALEQAGFDLSGGLSFDVAGDRGQQQQQNQAWQDQGDAGRAFQGRAFRAALETAGDAAEAANQGALRLRRGVNAGLDVRI